MSIHADLSLYVDEILQPSRSNIKDCHISINLGVLKAECSYPSDSLATGFQMIAQQKTSAQVHMLIVNQTRNRQTEVTLQTNEDGVYEVVIFAIGKGYGILDSDMKYSEVVMVNNMNKDTFAIPAVVLGNKVSGTLVYFNILK